MFFSCCLVFAISVIKSVKQLFTDTCLFPEVGCLDWCGNKVHSMLGWSKCMSYHGQRQPYTKLATVIFHIYTMIGDEESWPSRWLTWLKHSIRVYATNLGSQSQCFSSVAIPLSSCEASNLYEYRPDCKHLLKVIFQFAWLSWTSGGSPLSFNLTFCGNYIWRHSRSVINIINWILYQRKVKLRAWVRRLWPSSCKSLCQWDVVCT